MGLGYREFIRIESQGLRRVLIIAALGVNRFSFSLDWGESRLFPATPLHITLSLQIRLNPQSIPAVVNNPPTLLSRQAFHFSGVAIIGVDVVELDLQGRVFLDEGDGFYICIFERVE